MSVIYNIFLRNWVNSRATEEQVRLAVTKGLITQKEADIILATEQNPV